LQLFAAEAIQLELQSNWSDINVSIGGSIGCQKCQMLLAVLAISLLLKLANNESMLVFHLVIWQNE